MQEKNINEQILSFLEDSTSPMTLESIADAFIIPQNREKRALDELQCGGKVRELSPENKNNGRKYYTTTTKKFDCIDENIDNHLEKTIVQETVNVRDDYKDLSEKIEAIDKNVNGIYANIISIIAVFVAIFALITVNANIAFELTNVNMRNVFFGIIVVNIFVIACIIALLVATRLIIINPIINGKKKK